MQRAPARALSARQPNRTVAASFTIVFCPRRRRRRRASFSWSPADSALLLRIVVEFEQRARPSLRPAQRTSSIAARVMCAAAGRLQAAQQETRQRGQFASRSCRVGGVRMVREIDAAPIMMMMMIVVIIFKLDMRQAASGRRAKVQ